MLPPVPPVPPDSRPEAPEGPQGGSFRAYARHRAELGLSGASHQAVARAAGIGRLRGALSPDGRTVVNFERADLEWAANTDLSKAPLSVRLKGGRRPTGADGEEDGGDGGEEAGLSDMQKASAREKFWKAELAELTFRERAGELVDAAEMQAKLEATFSIMRTKLLGLPSKAKQRLPHLTLTDLATLEEVVNEALEELAGLESDEEPAA